MNKSIRRILAVLAVLALPSAGLRAADEYSTGFGAPNPGMIGEAGKAVVDRVFGVKGEAADIKYHAIELSNHSPVNAAIRSALLPGWGQRFNRQPIKGAAFTMVIGVGAYAAIRAYDRSKDDYNSYKAIGVRNDTTYDNYQRHRTQSIVLGGATIALWTYSVIDAYRNAYNPLWTRDPAIRLALQEDGAAVEWRRRF